MNDLEAALTRIESSGSDDEPLMRPSSGGNVVARRSSTEGPQEGGRLRRLRRVVPVSQQDEGSTVVDAASSGVVRATESPILSTVQVSSRAIRVRYRMQVPQLLSQCLQWPSGSPSHPSLPLSGLRRRLSEPVVGRRRSHPQIRTQEALGKLNGGRAGCPQQIRSSGRRRWRGGC